MAADHEKLRLSVQQKLLSSFAPILREAFTIVCICTVLKKKSPPAGEL